jgi:hypothetical protein
VQVCRGYPSLGARIVRCSALRRVIEGQNTLQEFVGCIKLDARDVRCSALPSVTEGQKHFGDLSGASNWMLGLFSGVPSVIEDQQR